MKLDKASDVLDDTTRVMVDRKIRETSEAVASISPDHTETELFNMLQREIVDFAHRESGEVPNFMVNILVVKCLQNLENKVVVWCYREMLKKGNHNARALKENMEVEV